MSALHFLHGFPRPFPVPTTSYQLLAVWPLSCELLVSTHPVLANIKSLSKTLNSATNNSTFLDQKNLYKSLIKISVKLFTQSVCVSAATALKEGKEEKSGPGSGRKQAIHFHLVDAHELECYTLSYTALHNPPSSHLPKKHPSSLHLPAKTVCYTRCMIKSSFTATS